LITKRAALLHRPSYATNHPVRATTPPARVKAGLGRAKTNPRAGAKATGRPRAEGRGQRAEASTEAAIRGYLTAGVGIGKVARTLDMGGSTVQRVKRETETALGGKGGHPPPG